MQHKITFALVVTVLFYSSGSFAMDQIGPPVATLSKGEWRIGLDYSYSDLDFDVSGPIAGTPIYDKALGNAEIHKAFLNVGYGVMDNLELILRLGGAQMEVNGEEEKRQLVDFTFFEDDSGLSFAFGAEIRFTFYKTENLKCGALYSFSSFDFDDFPKVDGRNRSGYLSTITPEIKLTKNQIAVGIDYNLMQNLSLYGGPLLHFTRGDAELQFKPQNPAINRTTENWDLEADSPYGSFFGTRLSILSSDFNINYAITKGGWGMGAQWLYRF